MQKLEWERVIRSNISKQDYQRFKAVIVRVFEIIGSLDPLI